MAYPICFSQEDFGVIHQMKDKVITIGEYRELHRCPKCKDLPENLYIIDPSAYSLFPIYYSEPEESMVVLEPCNHKFVCPSYYFIDVIDFPEDVPHPLPVFELEKLEKLEK